jgi:micrococcal nuclease
LILALLAGCWLANHGCPARLHSLPRTHRNPEPEPVAQGIVVRVFDGDTFLLEGDLCVRLKGIDTPEKDQPGYGEARRALESWISGARVRLTYDARDRVDRYGRLLAFVSTPDCASVNEALLRSGWAWIYRLPPGSRLRDAYRKVQQAAMEEGKGVWSRFSNREGPYHGSRNSGIFHGADCLYGNKISEKNRIRFEDLRSAYRDGYSPCRSCIHNPMEGR